MNAPGALTKVDRIRLRDGDRCWLCNGKLDFQAVPNTNKAPTIEHLIAKSTGGTGALGNLVLTHAGCNRQLGARPIEDKRRLRVKYQAARERAHAAREVCASTPMEEGGRKQLERSIPPESSSHGRALRRWQAWAAMAAGTALLAVGFAAGMLVAR